MRRNYKKDIVLQTKILPPQVKKNALNRPRLIRRLKENINRKLILINAGAGYGKTTLILQFLSEIKSPHVFYLLETGDCELSVFFSYLIAGIKRIYPAFGRRTENILNTIKNPSEYLKMTIGTFINEVVEKVPEDLIIVLDDYHNINRSRQITEALNYLLSHAPSSLHFILLSRQLPHLLSSQMKAKSEFFELSTQDLKFTSTEIKKLFKSVNLICLNKNEIKTIEKHSEGWVTSLQLMLQSSRGSIKSIIKSHDSLSDIKNYREWQIDYFNYFAQEIYSRESQDIKQFMVDCSVIELLNEEICYALTKKRDSKRILNDFEKKNVFLSRMPNSNYRFHHLFRDFLFSKLIDSRQKKKIYVKAANYFFKIEQLENAIHYYIEAGHYNRAINIIKKIGNEFTNKGKSETLCSYIDKLPVHMVNQDADLLMVYGYALTFRGYPNEATVNILNAAKILRKRRKSSARLANAFYTLGSINFISGNYKSAKKWMTKALKIYPMKRDLTRAGILSSLGLLYSRMGYRKFRDAIECFKAAYKIVKKIPKNEGLEASIINNWAMAERKSGNINAAYEKLLDAINLLKKEENFSPHCGIIFSNAAKHCIYLGKIKQAHSILKLGIENSKTHNDISSLAALWRGCAHYYEELGDLHRAKAHLEKAKDIVDELKIKRMALAVNQDLCRINAALGQLAEAEQNLAAIQEVRQNRENPEAVLTLLTEAQLRISQDKLDIAEKILFDSLKVARKYKRVFESFSTLLELAKVMYKREKINEAADMLKQAVRLSKEKRYDYLLSTEIQKEKWMLDVLLKINKKYVLSILNQGYIPCHLIEIFLFGRPHVIVDGKKIHSELWKTSKAMKLFCHLCMSKEKVLSRDTLIDAIWKDVPLQKSSKSFRKAIHNIRKAFQSVTATDDSPVTYRDRLYVISKNFSVRLDTEEFVNLLNKADLLKNNYEELKTTIKKAATIYQNGLANSWYDEWVDELRSYYNRLYEEKLLMLVDHAIKNDDYKDSLAWLKRLILINFYEEEYHHKLWRVYAHLGKYKDIKQDFFKLKQSFKKELKIDLQQETVELYKSLILQS